MPSSSAVYKIVEKYHFTQFDIIDNMFKSMSKGHGNLKGKSKTLTWSFIGTINSYISLSFNGVSGLVLNEKANLCISLCMVFTRNAAFSKFQF